MGAQPTSADEESPQRSRVVESSVPRSERSRRSLSNESKTSERASSRSRSPSSHPPSSRSSSRDRSESPNNTTTEASPEREQTRRSPSHLDSPRKTEEEPAVAPQESESNVDEPQANAESHAAPGGLDVVALNEREEAPPSQTAPVAVLVSDENEPSPAKSNATQDEYGLDEFDEDE
eukprot:TRINITY_DN17672_c0_g1_i1.p1 TRINITY_DN17672_c0_g1~~TRINITY_DN17672_c0_g1_i1.p1  ORF type:complete len:185 (-),score=12.49 TRINITY_DN17672_c0_g1_i1:192-722(-)